MLYNFWLYFSSSCGAWRLMVMPKNVNAALKAKAWTFEVKAKAWTFGSRPRPEPSGSRTRPGPSRSRPGLKNYVTESEHHFQLQYLSCSMTNQTSVMWECLLCCLLPCNILTSVWQVDRDCCDRFADFHFHSAIQIPAHHLEFVLSYYYYYYCYCYKCWDYSATITRQWLRGTLGSSHTTACYESPGERILKISPHLPKLLSNIKWEHSVELLYSSMQTAVCWQSERRAPSQPYDWQKWWVRLVCPPPKKMSCVRSRSKSLVADCSMPTLQPPESSIQQLQYWPFYYLHELSLCALWWRQCEPQDTLWFMCTRDALCEVWMMSVQEAFID